MEPKDFESRRRAVRIAASSDVKAVFKANEQTFTTVKILDMSTLGMGIQVDQDPQADEITIQFLAPEILSGLNILCKVRRKVQNFSSEGGLVLGLEFTFSSMDQQNILLRWLSSYLQKHLPAKDASDLSYMKADKGFGAPGPNNFIVRFPRSIDELEQSYYLMQPLNVYHALIQTKIFLLIHQSEIAALVPLIVDTIPFKLPLDQYFGDYADSLRKDNRRLGEISLPKFNENSSLLRAHPSIVLRKLHILFSMFIHLVVYSKNFANLTDLLVLVPVQLQEFFRLWLFSDLRNEVDVEAVRNAQISEFRFMRLDLINYNERLAEKRPELYEQLKTFELTAGILSNFQNSYFPDKDFLEKWFVRKRQTLTHLSEEQKSYFKVLVPDLKL